MESDDERVKLSLSLPPAFSPSLPSLPPFLSVSLSHTLTHSGRGSSNCSMLACVCAERGGGGGGGGGGGITTNSVFYSG
jgi:hypothetical protein